MILPVETVQAGPAKYLTCNTLAAKGSIPEKFKPDMTSFQTWKTNSIVLFCQYKFWHDYSINNIQYTIGYKLVQNTLCNKESIFPPNIANLFTNRSTRIWLVCSVTIAMFETNLYSHFSKYVSSMRVPERLLFFFNLKIDQIIFNFITVTAKQIPYWNRLRTTTITTREIDIIAMK